MQNQENENYQDTFSQYQQQLMSSNWKTRKDTLEIISKNMENPQLQSVFWQMVNILMREQNIQCLGLTLQILHEQVLNIPRNRLEEIVFILVNNNLLNQKTSIHKITEDLLLAISSQYPKLVLDTITVSLDSKIAKQIKSSLLFLQLLVMQQHQLETKQISQLDFCQSVLNILQTKDLLVRKQVIEVIDLLLQMSTNQQELLDFLQAHLDKQLFQNIVNQLMTENVSDEEIINVLQDKTEKNTPQPKKTMSSPSKSTQIVGQSLGNSHFLKEDTYTPSYTELSQLIGMNWKDKKQILEQLTKEFEEQDKITQQLSSEFCRQLRQLLEEENNIPCLNQLIKLTGEICLKVQGCKYLRTLFSALFQCLRNKKCQSQAQTTLLTLLQVVRIQDIIDSDILPAMQTRQTEFKIDVLNFIRATYQLNPGNLNDQILPGCIIRDVSQHEKLLKLLLNMCNDSNNVIRQAASEAVVQFIAVHIQLRQYKNIVYSMVVQGYVQETNDVPQTPEQLIYIILTFTGQQSVRSNEQRRGGALLSSLMQLLSQFNINSMQCNLPQVFRFSSDVQQLIDQLNQNMPVSQTQKSVLKKNIQDKQNSPVKLTASQQLGQDFQQMSYQRQGYSQPEFSQKPQYQDITKLQSLIIHPNPIQQIIDRYSSQLANADQKLLYNFYGEIAMVLQNLQQHEKQIAIDMVFDACIQYMAQGDENLLIQCIQFIKQIVLQYQSDTHPTTLLKTLDVLIFRMEEPQSKQFIFDFVMSVTQLYGMQIPLFFVQKYVAEQFIVNTLLQLLLIQLQTFGLQGFDFSYHIMFNPQNIQCNITQLLLICSSIDCEQQQILALMNLVSTLLAFNNQEQIFLMQQQIQGNEILSTISGQIQKIEIQQLQQVSNPIQIQSASFMPPPSSNFETRIPVISSAILDHQKQSNTPKISQNNVEEYGEENKQNTLNASSLQTPFSPKQSSQKLQTVQHIQLDNFYNKQDIQSLKVYFKQIFQTESPKFVLNESGTKKYVVNFITAELQNKVQQVISILKQGNAMITDALIQHCFMNNIYGKESDISEVQNLISILESQQNIPEIFNVLLYIHLCQSVIYNDIQQHNTICQLFALTRKDENYLDMLLLYVLQASYQAQNCSQLFMVAQIHFELKNLLDSVSIIFIELYENLINGGFVLHQTLKFILEILRVSAKNQPFTAQDQQVFVKCMLQTRSQLYFYDIELILSELQRITNSSECIKDLPLDIQKDLILPRISTDLTSYMQYLKNLSDNEQFIYGLKQIIIYIREQRQQSYHDITVQMQEQICMKLFIYINNKEQPNSRLLKYCALLLLELLNDQKSLKFFRIEHLQQIMRISSYYLMVYIPNLQLTDQSQQKLFSESYENFTLVCQRISTEIPYFQRYQTFIGELYNICNLLLTKDVNFIEQEQQQLKQQQYTFLDDIQFINQYQAQFVIKSLLQIQQVIKKEVGEQQLEIIIKEIVIQGLQEQFNKIMYLLTSKNTHSIQANELMQLITSQPISGLVYIDQLLSQISAQQEIELKELKLFLRFTRIFVEFYINIIVELQFSEYHQLNYFMLLVQAVSEQKQLSTTLQGSLIKEQPGSVNADGQQTSQVRNSVMQQPQTPQRKQNYFGQHDNDILASLQANQQLTFDGILSVYQKIKATPDFKNNLKALLENNRISVQVINKIEQQLVKLQQCEQEIMHDLRK